MAEIQHGTGNVYGIAAVTITVAGAQMNGNISNQKWSEDFKRDEMPAQTGDRIEGVISYQRVRTLEFDFAPKSTTRALAIAEAKKFLSWTPNAVVTIAASGNTPLNGTFNLKSGGGFTRTKEGVAVCSVKVAQYEVAGTANTFASLAVI